ncbi:MAG: helix-turn-helix domain-containing protein [Rikenellaceae bacterium]|nr:helix-turn-helix domain-containing protein [Rikenellaceae bacterium]
MENTATKERISKLSISRIRKHFIDSGYESEDFMISPLLRFKTMEGSPRIIEGGVTVGIVCNGTAKISVNSRTYELRKDYIFLLNEESVISNFRCTKACMGYLITFSREFVDSINVEVPDFMTAQLLVTLKPCIPVSPVDIDRLHSIATVLSSSILKDDFQYRDKVVSSLFTGFYYTLIAVLSKYASQDTVKIGHNRGDKLLAHFIANLSRDYEREHTVEYYARQLDITPKYLSLICKKRTGKNASTLIDEAVIHKAKELLKQSGMSILEVSQRLNFVSQSFFGKYFKEHMGVSPSRFKAASAD